MRIVSSMGNDLIKLPRDERGRERKVGNNELKSYHFFLLKYSVVKSPSGPVRAFLTD